MIAQAKQAAANQTKSSARFEKTRGPMIVKKIVIQKYLFSNIQNKK
jgi:hypothetical protein